ncbi:ribosomal maturation YjgA family protein [Cellulosimicrobium sp. Marseille-Q8652]
MTPARRRVGLGVALAAVVLAGLVVATRAPDPWGDVGGDVLYAVATYLLVALVLARSRPSVVGGVALAWCWAVEALQATGVAAAVNDEVPPAAWLLGSTFAVRDLVCYAVGVVLAAGGDVLARSLVARRARRHATADVTPSARTSG